MNVRRPRKTWHRVLILYAGVVLSYLLVVGVVEGLVGSHPRSLLSVLLGRLHFALVIGLAVAGLIWYDDYRARQALARAYREYPRGLAQSRHLSLAGDPAPVLQAAGDLLREMGARRIRNDRTGPLRARLRGQRVEISVTEGGPHWSDVEIRSTPRWPFWLFDKGRNFHNVMSIAAGLAPTCPQVDEP